MKRSVLFCLVAVALLGGADAGAQSYAFTGPLIDQPFRLTIGSGRAEGFGARALGMGGAFTAVADDATAAEWNPAGLAQIDRVQFQLGGQYLDTEIDRSLAIEQNLRQGALDLRTVVYEDSSASDSSPQFDFATIAYPILLGKYKDNTLVIGASYFQNRVFFEDYQFTNTAIHPDPDVGGLGFVLYQRDAAGQESRRFVTTFDSADTNQRESGQQSNLALSLAYSARDKVFFGITVTQKEEDRTVLTESIFTNIEQTTQFRSANEEWVDLGEAERANSHRSSQYFDTRAETLTFTLGFLWRASEKWAIGATYRPSVSLDYEYTITRSLRQETDAGVFEPVPETDRGVSTVDTPSILSGGIAFHPTARWVLALDYQQSDWADSTFSSMVTDNGVQYNRSFYYPSFLRESGEDYSWETGAAVGGRNFGGQQFEDTVIRFGIEHTFPGDGWDFLVRAGAFREDAVSGVPMSDQPQIDGYSFGIGYVRQKFFLDLTVVHESTSINTSDVSTDGFYSSFPYVNWATGVPMDQENHWQSLNYEPTTLRAVLAFGYQF